MKRQILPGFLVAWLIAGTFALALSACPQSAVQRQSLAAASLSRLFNRALPVWIEVFEDDGERAIAAATTPAEGREALNRVYRRWEPVRDAWEAARAAHQVWRGELERCQGMPDAARCEANLRLTQARVVLQVTQFRCSLRAIGRGWVDELPGNPDCSTLVDGGLSDGHE